MKQTIDNFFIGLIMFIILISAGGIIFESIFYNKVYPGVTVAGIKVGTLNASQTENKIAASSIEINQFLLDWGVNQWVIKSEDIDLKFEPKAMAEKALKVGRSGNFAIDLLNKFQAIKGQINLEPIYNLRTDLLDQAVEAVAGQIDIPASEPEIQKITFPDLGILLNLGKDGLKTDSELLKNKILVNINNMANNHIDIPVTELTPKLTAEEAEFMKNKAKVLLGKKLVMKLDSDGQKWEVGDEEMLTWLNLQTGEWSNDRISFWLTELAQNVDRKPQNAAFKFLGEGRVEEFRPARDGLEVDFQENLNKVLAGLNELINGKSEAILDLAVRYTSPEIRNNEANDLGINSLIGKGESWYSGSITNRIFNLKKAAEHLSGILVAPGEIFSFNKAVGEVSANTGYKQAYIIKDGKTILGDGGGVCQVSSTLFRAVLATGLPITERVAHAYRVHYYEEKYQPGFDATVFQPAPDFQFQNDTPGYILIQMNLNEKIKHLVFEIYGTNDGRKVEISKARIWEMTAPPPDLYQDDPTLPVGKVVQTEHAAWGAKVAFDWKVTRDEEVLQERTFYSNYRPWQAVYLRGVKPL